MVLTTIGVDRAGGAGRAGRRPGHDLDEARAYRVFRTMILIVIFAERIALPLGGSQQIPLTLPLVLAVTLYGFVTGVLVPVPRRIALYGVAVAGVSAMTVIAEARQTYPSLPSLILLILIYVPALFTNRHARAATAALRFFVDLMVVLGILGLVLFLAQFVGFGYQDYIGDIVPQSFVQQGFITSYPIHYASPIYRSNGTVFLEASFFSFFLGLAVMVSVQLNYRLKYLPILLAGLVICLSGNGLVFVGVSVAYVALRGPNRRRLLVLVAPALLAGVIAGATPLGSVLTGRVTEVNTHDSSGNLRLVQPYQVLTPAYTSSVASLLVGNGAGSVAKYLASTTQEVTGQPAIIAPAIPKILYEYGLFGALPFLGFLVFLLVPGERLAYTPGVLIGYFGINAALQQATLAMTAFLFLAVLVPRTSARGSQNSLA